MLPELSTKRLLTMTWLEGRRLMDYKGAPLEHRNAIARAMFRAWWFPFSHYGVIHGDPHLGNYTIFEEPGGNGAAASEEGTLGVPAGINLLDYGCIRTFPTPFVQGVIDLYNGLLHDKRDLVVHAYETWGFGGLSNELIDTLNIWARFIYGPLLDDRERVIADGTTPGQYGRKEAFTVHKALKEKGPVRVPREFVFMDRAAIGLGGVFLHLGAQAQLAQHVQRHDPRLHARRGGGAAEGGIRGGRRAATDGRVRRWPSRARSGSGSAGGRSSRGAACSTPRACRIPASWSTPASTSPPSRSTARSIARRRRRRSPSGRRRRRRGSCSPSRGRVTR